MLRANFCLQVGFARRISFLVSCCLPEAASCGFWNSYRRSPALAHTDLKEQARSAATAPDDDSPHMTEVMQIILRAGFRAMLVAPLIRGEEIVGSGGVTGLGL